VVAPPADGGPGDQAVAQPLGADYNEYPVGGEPQE